MIKITIDSKELYDEENAVFIYQDSYTVELEHSLKSIFEWEAIFKKPFLTKDNYSEKELLRYFELMDESGILNAEDLSEQNKLDIINYIGDSNTATIIEQKASSRLNKRITSEEIYAMMFEARIPIECERWNLSRLMVLINVMAERRNPKKMSNTEIFKENDELNKKRRELYKSRG